MNPARTNRKKLHVEALERRDLMALWDGPVGYMDQGPNGPPRLGGNVTAEVIDGRLIIRGDAGPNGVMIYALQNGVYRIDSVNGWSLINGVNTRPGNDPTFSWHAPEVSGVWRSIDVDMGDGDDFVSIQGNVPEVHIRTGAGDDAVDLENIGTLPYSAITWGFHVPGPAGVSGNLTIDTGDGNDRASIYAIVTGNALVQLGAGDDMFLEVGGSGGFYGPSRIVLSATGTRTVNLGPGEEGVPVPDDWRDDPGLTRKLHPHILNAFEQYADDLAAGLVLPGEEWRLVQENDPTYVAVIRGDGRMQLQFFFSVGVREIIDRLQSRWMQFDAYSLDLGLAYVSVNEVELRYFAHLLGFGQILPRLNFWGGNPPKAWDYARDGVLPTGTPMKLPTVTIPEPPITNPPVANPPVSDPPANVPVPINDPGPPYIGTVLTPPTVYGPVRLEDLGKVVEESVNTAPQVPEEYFGPTDEPTAPSLADETLSLIASYYGTQERPGPKRLDEIGPRWR